MRERERLREREEREPKNYFVSYDARDQTQDFMLLNPTLYPLCNIPGHSEHWLLNFAYGTLKMDGSA